MQFLEERRDEAKALYDKQRNLCVSLLSKTKRNYFSQIDTAVSDRKFWKTVSPLFSEKTFNRESVILKENTETVTDNYKLAETFNMFFINLVQNLDINN